MSRRRALSTTAPVQQGEAREKSEMHSRPEAKMGKKWGVPKIGAYIPDDGEYDDPVLRVDAWGRPSSAPAVSGRRAYAPRSSLLKK